jgi:hypothetical protein
MLRGCQRGADARRAATGDNQNARSRLLVRLGAEPLWLAGLGASIVGFGLEATALAVAPVVLVQPLIVGELLFALPLAAAQAAGDPDLGRKTRVLITESPDGGWGIGGAANTRL